MFIDTHTHINDEKLYIRRDEIISDAIKAGVKIIVNAADSFDSIERIVSISKEYSGICYPVVGIYPCEAKTYDQMRLDRIIQANINNILALGEIGLDYHYDLSFEEKVIQKEVFISQILLAKRYSLPLVIHSRDADMDTFNILQEYGKGLSIDLHCYSGSLELAKQYILEFPNIKFGIGGVITFSNGKRLKRVVEGLDLKYFVLETDAPYLAPTPHRGTLNEPRYIPLIAQKIAEIKNVSLDDVEKITTKNAKELYRL